MKQPSLYAMASEKQSFCCKQGAREHKGKDQEVDVLVSFNGAARHQHRVDIGDTDRGFGVYPRKLKLKASLTRVTGTN